MRISGLSLTALGLHPLSGFSATQAQPVVADEEVRRLLFNENPDGPSEGVKKIIPEVLHRANKYVTFFEYDFQALKQRIAEQEGLQPENVLLGHGSFEPLVWVAQQFGSNGEQIIVPSPSFDVVGNFGRKIGAEVIPVEVDQDFKIDLEGMESRVNSKTRLVTVCNPNNPTGTRLNPERLQAFCESVSEKAFVLVDEAYIHYVESWRDHTMAPLIQRGENVLVTRTFSKIYGMAGLRIGFMLGPAELVHQLEAKYTLGFPGNMPNSLSVAAAMAALGDEGFVEKSRKRNDQRKAQFYEALRVMDIPYVPSAANHVYYDVGNFQAYKELMWRHKILLTGGWPTKPNWARVTLGADEDMEFLLEKMQGKPWM